MYVVPNGDGNNFQRFSFGGVIRFNEDEARENSAPLVAGNDTIGSLPLLG